jgi:CIC family chloride channel protein
VIAHAVALLFMKNSIMTEKLARRGLRVNQEYEVDVFQQVTVGQVMDRAPALVPADTPLGELAERINRGEQALTSHQAVLLTDPVGELAGILTRGDITRALVNDRAGSMPVLEAGHSKVHVTYADETLGEALNRMLRFNCGRLPVVDRAQPRRIVGYLGRTALLQARLHRLHEERVPEPGWLNTTLRSKPR